MPTKVESNHLSEYRAPGATEIMQGSPIIENGQRVWKKYRDIEIDSDIFPKIGKAFEQTGQVTVAQVGSATTRIFRQRPAIDFATEWFTHKRNPQQGIL
jgi:aminoglycoside 3-N-acetyltransferase